MSLFIQLPSSWTLILNVKIYGPIEVIPTEEGVEILAVCNCHVLSCVLNIAWRNGITSSHFRCRFLDPCVTVWRRGNSHRDLFCRCRCYWKGRSTWCWRDWRIWGRIWGIWIGRSWRWSKLVKNFAHFAAFSFCGHCQIWMEWVYWFVSSHWAYILVLSPSSRQRSDCCCSNAMISVNWRAFCFCGYHLHLIAKGVLANRHIIIPTIAIGNEVGLRPFKKGITSWIQFADVFLQRCHWTTGISWTLKHELLCVPLLQILTLVILFALIICHCGIFPPSRVFLDY